MGGNSLFQSLSSRPSSLQSLPSACYQEDIVAKSLSWNLMKQPHFSISPIASCFETNRSCDGPKKIIIHRSACFNRERISFVLAGLLPANNLRQTFSEPKQRLRRRFSPTRSIILDNYERPNTATVGTHA